MIRQKFNFKDSISKMILHSEAGIGIDAVNLQSRKKMASAYKKVSFIQIES